MYENCSHAQFAVFFIIFFLRLVVGLHSLWTWASRWQARHCRRAVLARYKVPWRAIHSRVCGSLLLTSGGASVDIGCTLVCVCFWSDGERCHTTKCDNKTLLLGGEHHILSWVWAGATRQQANPRQEIERHSYYFHLKGDTLTFNKGGFYLLFRVWLFLSALFEIHMKVFLICQVPGFFRTFPTDIISPFL